MERQKLQKVKEIAHEMVMACGRLRTETNTCLSFYKDDTIKTPPGDIQVSAPPTCCPRALGAPLSRRSSNLCHRLACFPVSLHGGNTRAHLSHL